MTRIFTRFHSRFVFFVVLLLLIQKTKQDSILEKLSKSLQFNDKVPKEVKEIGTSIKTQQLKSSLLPAAQPLDTAYYVQTIKSPGTYSSTATKSKYSISSTGTVIINSNSNNVITYYMIYNQANNSIFVQNFQITSDIIDLTDFTTITSIQNLDYTVGPLTFYLPNNQIITLTSVTFFTLTASNFVFSSPTMQPVTASSSSSSSSSGLDSGVISIIVVIGTLTCCSIIFCRYYQSLQLNRDKVAKEALEQHTREKIINSRTPSNNSSARSNASRPSSSYSKRSTRKVGSFGGTNSRKGSEKGSKRITNDFLTEDEQLALAIAASEQDDFESHLFTSSTRIHRNTHLKDDDDEESCLSNGINDVRSAEEAGSPEKGEMRGRVREALRPILPALPEEASEMTSGKKSEDFSSHEVAYSAHILRMVQL